MNDGHCIESYKYTKATINFERVLLGLYERSIKANLGMVYGSKLHVKPWSGYTRIVGAVVAGTVYLPCMLASMLVRKGLQRPRHGCRSSAGSQILRF